MLRTFVNVNNHTFDFFDYKEAITYIMSLTISHHKYAMLSTLKENIYETCNLISELLDILHEKADDKSEKMHLKRLNTKIFKSKEFLMRQKDKDSFLLSWGDLMMLIEDKGLLHGYGFGNKYKDNIKGNSEKISVTRTVYQ